MRNLVKAAFVFWCLTASGAALSADQVIQFSEHELYPEGIVYDVSAHQFLVSSLHYGKIGRVGFDGIYQDFIHDPLLISSVGLHIDPLRKRLLVAVSDPGVGAGTTPATQGKLAALAIYSLKNGQRLAYHDLGKLAAGAHFANDIAVDNRGNIYVTDSFSPIVYKIDTQGDASIFVQSELFQGLGFNLNGIVYHPKGFLIVAKSNTGELFKISLRGEISLIQTDLNLVGADGLVLLEDGGLAVIQNAGIVSRLKSKDNWKSASLNSVVTQGFNFPTTGVMAKDGLFVLNAKLGELFDPNATKSDVFSIREVDF
jgi:sugar lactone lactonase YvrE